MPDFLINSVQHTGGGTPVEIFTRLAVALLLGFVVAGIYKATRRSSGSSFPATLVLLSVLIAMVTQVIGDNVARAFSLVGALSIVRFRTVVRDTQDTAYVIFAVVIGMAVGAGNPWVAAGGIAVIGCASGFMRIREVMAFRPHFLLTVSTTLGKTPENLSGTFFADSLSRPELVAVSTIRQGAAMEYIYETQIKPSIPPDDFVRKLHVLDGIQSVDLRRGKFEET